LDFTPAEVTQAAAGNDVQWSELDRIQDAATSGFAAHAIKRTNTLSIANVYQVSGKNWRRERNQ
jgi:hypothetical protein